MRPRRSALAMLAILILVAFCLPAASQTGNSGTMSNKEINDLKREIQQKERMLRKFESAMSKLKTAARQSSNSAARQAVENTDKLMGEVIRTEERKLGKDYSITQHGENVEVVSTDDLTRSRGVRTNDNYVLPADTPPEYIRLVRMQQIYVSLQTLSELAVARNGDAPERYGKQVRDFAGLMQEDLATLKAKLPDEDETGNKDSMKTDSSGTGTKAP